MMFPEEKRQSKKALKNYAAFIETHCSEVVEDYRHVKQCLFRGMKARGFAFIDSSPTNRIPRDTKISIQKKVDDKLQKEGFKALRSNSIFCTSDFSEARAYPHYSNTRNPYIIFPINGFDYTFSFTYSDFLKDFRWYGYNSLEDAIDDLTPKEFVRRGSYSRTGLRAALNSGHEVMIHGNYVAIRSNDAGLYICALLGINIVRE